MRFEVSDLPEQLPSHFSPEDCALLAAWAAEERKWGFMCSLPLADAQRICDLLRVIYPPRSSGFQKGRQERKAA